MRCDSGKPAYLRLRRMCLTAAPSSSAPTHAHPSRFVRSSTHARSRTHTRTHTTRWALTYPDPVQTNLDGGLPPFSAVRRTCLPVAKDCVLQGRILLARSYLRRASHRYPAIMRLWARPRTAKDLISRSIARGVHPNLASLARYVPRWRARGRYGADEHIHVAAGTRRSKPFCTRESS